MTDQIKRRVRFWYGIGLAVLSVAVGVLFLAEAADIYFGATGQPIYTAEDVSRRLIDVCLAPFLIWIAAIIGGFVLSVVFPVKEKIVNRQDPRKTLLRLRRRVSREQGEPEDWQRIRNAEAVRIAIWCLTAAVSLAGAIYCLVYLFTSAHFSTSAFNREVLAMVKNVFPWVAAAVLCSCAAVTYERIAAKRVLPAMKRIVAAGHAPVTAFREGGAYALCRKVSESKWTRITVRSVLCVAGITFFILGIVNGGIDDVLIKATKICTECIGLG